MSAFGECQVAASQRKRDFFSFNLWFFVFILRIGSYDLLLTMIKLMDDAIPYPILRKLLGLYGYLIPQNFMFEK